MTDSIKTFTYHQDPGHGWLEVTKEDIEAVGLTLASFSTCSYYSAKRGAYYLEEDSDMYCFMKAYARRHDGLYPDLNDAYVNNNSHIRDMIPLHGD